MQNLEKILEEIDETIERYGTNPYIDVKVTDLCYGLNIAKDIIRKHMNDGWIPVEERLPNEEEFKQAYIRLRYAAEFVVMIRGANMPTTLYFKNGRWFDAKNRYYDVVAWRLLPGPYRPERSKRK